MNYLRQLDILDPKLITFPIALIGYGGIGSPTGLLLSIMGCNDLTLKDGDRVEDHNFPNQVFFKEDEEIFKVDAGRSVITKFTDCDPKISHRYYESCDELSGVVISGVDKMSVRQTIWDGVKYNVDVPLYIDGRIGAEQIEVFTIRPSDIEDIEFYEEKWLFDDSEVAELPCTGRSIMYIGFMIAALIASQFKKWIKGEPYYGRISYNLLTNIQVTQHEVATQ
ncbi:ThiF family adenylyltransferase [bacterium]|nr:ThiF family adenylyltransferase [bacterium]